MHEKGGDCKILLLRIKTAYLSRIFAPRQLGVACSSSLSFQLEKNHNPDLRIGLQHINFRCTILEHDKSVLLCSQDIRNNANRNWSDELDIVVCASQTTVCYLCFANNTEPHSGPVHAGLSKHFAICYCKFFKCKITCQRQWILRL